MGATVAPAAYITKTKRKEEKTYESSVCSLRVMIGRCQRLDLGCQRMQFIYVLPHVLIFFFAFRTIFFFGYPIFKEITTTIITKKIGFFFNLISKDQIFYLNILEEKLKIHQVSFHVLLK